MSVKSHHGSAWRLGLSALRRDWRSGELNILLLALVIAVVAVTSVGFLADRVSQALTSNSVQMLGGDLALEADAPVPEDFIQRAQGVGLDTVLTVSFPSMVGTQSGVRLASVRAVSNGYPLYPGLRLEAGNGQTRLADRAPAPGTAWVDPQILTLLSVEPGGALDVGDLSMTISGVIAYEPDRGVRFVNVAPRVMINAADLESTGLLGLGSRARYGLLVAGSGDALASYRGWLENALTPGQRLQSIDDASPEIRGSLQRAHQFLMLVALLTVMIAAVAVALATRRYQLRHRDGVAIMRCLGAARRQLQWALVVEFVVFSVGASALGVALGYGVHQVLVAAVAVVFDTPLPSPSWHPAGQGFVTGLLLLLGFALAPLAELGRVAPARVLRQDAGTTLKYRATPYVLGLAGFFALALWVSSDVMLSVVIVGGVLLVLAVCSVLAWLGVSALGYFRQQSAAPSVLRFALAGIARRKSLVVTQVCALSIGLLILLLLSITRTDLLQGWQNALPDDAPNTFLINIQPGQRQAVQSSLQSAGIALDAPAPMVRGRLVTINRQPVDSRSYGSPRAQRMIDREFNLSWRADLPDSNRVVAGRWLDVTANEVSLESGVADTLGVGLGDELGFDIAGEQVVVQVTSLRSVKWDSFDVNFFALMSPGVLDNAPTSYLTAFYLPADKSGLIQGLVNQFPNLTVFDVGAMLTQLKFILDQVVQAVQTLFVFTIAAGILVLAAAFFSTRDERMREVAILRMLGANSRQLSVAMAIELVLIGGLSGVLASFGAVAIAWVLAEQVIDITFTWPLWPWLVGSTTGALAALFAGNLALRGVLKTAPLLSLRTMS
ncbi:MAG: ABC transporter permease [Pusillimonas sp.]